MVAFDPKFWQAGRSMVDRLEPLKILLKVFAEKQQPHAPGVLKAWDQYLYDASTIVWDSDEIAAGLEQADSEAFYAGMSITFTNPRSVSMCVAMCICSDSHCVGTTIVRTAVHGVFKRGYSPLYGAGYSLNPQLSDYTLHFDCLEEQAKNDTRHVIKRFFGNSTTLSQIALEMYQRFLDNSSPFDPDSLSELCIPNVADLAPHMWWRAFSTAADDAQAELITFPYAKQTLKVKHATAAKTLGRIGMLVCAASLSALSSETVWSDLGRRHSATRNKLGLERALNEVRLDTRLKFKRKKTTEFRKKQQASHLHPWLDQIMHA